MPKNLIIFSDGTGQEGGKGADSNVYSLFKAIKARSDDQISFYDQGLGTGRRWLWGKMTGFGISQNIMECYRFIFDNFNSGDKIYLIGFSRGAATVRSLTWLIHNFGIMPKSRPELIKKAYKIYKIQKCGKRKAAVKAFNKKHHTMWASVEFLGVWDTVAALGVPMPALDRLVNKIPWFRHKFHDFTLSECVINAYQALSIDDQRKTFHPILWNEDLYVDQIMEQVWFAGVHTDIGGGYEERALSDISLKWMTAKAVQHGLLLWHDCILTLEDQPDGHMHDSRGGFFGQFYVREERNWPKVDDKGFARGKPDIHPSVYERTKDQWNRSAPGYKPWILREKD